ncbi:3-hydroxyisobutyryl-coenzyme A hydrolase [Calocera viscosa TUFC12733]|uniref:3-hydroxyisobutyryl-CoA hydrolase n=1 Tax=Calocera viscosa (strain TUFC12733) TaxID=1330018 RepID=A0A167RPF8_CALVF|nr:3-hydroxyisobutyryl-coenzyme A hydrolase [Calocera viscosa TUFC12733]
MHMLRTPLPLLLRSMSPRPGPGTLTASSRLRAIQRAMASTSAPSPPPASEREKQWKKVDLEQRKKDGRAMGTNPERYDQALEVPVLFENHQFTRTYVLNRPKALNALNEEMISLLGPKLRAWNESSGAKIIIGTGKGRAFCAGGDVRAVVKDATSDDPEHRSRAAGYFKHEFELDFELGNLDKPYVAILDGITMGGGLGLSMNAPFRVATENTQVAMPETKIGYAPDVGATFFLPQLDGKLGTYLALTGTTIKGRAVYELGIATHFVPSERIPKLLERLSALNPQDFSAVDQAIAEHATDDYQTFETDLVGEKRKVLDEVFGKPTVEGIVSALQGVRGKGGEIGAWAEQVLGELELRSPTALKVALEAQRKGNGITLQEALQVELRFATAFCNGASPDFITGVRAVLEEKIKGRPEWQPATLEEISHATIIERFFSADSPYTKDMPTMEFVDGLAEPRKPMHYSLPTEKMIGSAIKGDLKDSGMFALTTEEVVAWFADKTHDKPGVVLKVFEVLKRKTRTKKDGYLEWIH